MKTVKSAVDLNQSIMDLFDVPCDLIFCFYFILFMCDGLLSEEKDLNIEKNEKNPVAWSGVPKGRRSPRYGPIFTTSFICSKFGEPSAEISINTLNSFSRESLTLFSFRSWTWKAYHENWKEIKLNE